MAKRNIVITGGAGFIGSHVVRLFVNKYPEYNIINLDKLTYAGNLANLKDVEDKPNYRFVKMDICDFDAFYKLMHTLNCGQVSINISKPGITKGEHWHHSKWETFIVVSGHGFIQMRKEGTDEIREYEVSGDKIQAVQMLPGYTHNIINLSDTDDLVTVMYCNERFNPNRPDTFFDPVKR